MHTNWPDNLVQLFCLLGENFFKGETKFNVFFFKLKGGAYPK